MNRSAIRAGRLASVLLLAGWLTAISVFFFFDTKTHPLPSVHAAPPGLVLTTTVLTDGGPVTQNSPPTFGDAPLIAPANGSTVTTARPGFDWDNAGAALTYTLLITTPGGNALTRTTTSSAYTPTHSLPGNGLYTWTVQAANNAGSSGFVSPYTFTLSITWRVYLPVVQKSPTCPATSGNTYAVIPFVGPPADRPGPEHADLNLALRGYSQTLAPTVLVDYNGGADPNAPQLDGILNDYPGISAVFRVNNWIWQSYPSPGYVGSPITDWDATLLELPAAYGAPLYIPDRGPDIYSGGYKAIVLYAEENRITLGYTRDDTVANGYAVHLEDICVDPNLLALYRAQTDSAGWHVTGQLPALKENQPLGTAFLSGARVAIRDRGAFMDPRSRKDWWMNWPAGLEIQRSHDTSLK